MKDEKDISAQKEAEKQGARVPPEDEDAGRKKDAQEKKRQGQKEDFRLNGRRRRMYTRLKKNNEFQRLFTRGKKCFSPALIILYMPSDRMRLGVCVSKKHGKSVRRNRIKRLLREAFRKVCPLFPRGYSVILIPKQAEEYSLSAFEKSLHSAMKREGLLK